MLKISKDDLSSLIELERLRNIVNERVDTLPSFRKQKEVVETNSVCKIVKVTLVVVGVLAAIAGVAFAIYKFITPDYDDEFDDDFDDLFDDEDDDDDLFEDDDE